jgi:hypothetical protein
VAVTVKFVVTFIQLRVGTGKKCCVVLQKEYLKVTYR